MDSIHVRHRLDDLENLPKQRQAQHLVRHRLDDLETNHSKPKRSR